MLVRDLSKELKITNKELVAFLKDNEFEVSNHMSSVTDEMITLAKEMFAEPVVDETKPEVVEKKYNQTDLILCRSVCPGWLGMSGRSGQFYVFSEAGDEAEVEYQDLYSLKNKRSQYIYGPLIIIEDEELLNNPRWSDVKKFYEESVYTNDDVEAVLDLPQSKFKSTLMKLPNGLKKAIAVKAAQKIEEGTLDSLSKIKSIDEVCGTDFYSILE